MDCFNRCFAADPTAAMLVVSYAVGFFGSSRIVARRFSPVRTIVA